MIDSPLYPTESRQTVPALPLLPYGPSGCWAGPTLFALQHRVIFDDCELLPAAPGALNKNAREARKFPEGITLMYKHSLVFRC